MLFQILILSPEIEATRPCDASEYTLRNVTHCPTNKTQWEIRSSLFQCSLVNQTCVDPPSDFQYHCVLNENRTGLIEVCAPFKQIPGK